MNEHDHQHPKPEPLPPPETPVDAGSQALAEALRSSFTIVKFVMALLVVVFLGSGFFTLKPQERAVILRLGRPVGEGQKALLSPGKLHWSFPYPIDECVRVPVTDIQTVSSTVGWYAVTPEQLLAGIEPPPAGTLNPIADGYVMTADANIVHSRATLTYRIKDPIRYVFSFINASNTVQSLLDNALLRAAASFIVDDALTRDVAGFQDDVRRRVTQLVDQQDIGVTVEQCAVRTVPPRQLKEAFAGVLRAEVMRSKVLDGARSYENQVTNKAGADAESLINLAQSDRARLTNDIAAQACRFEEILPQYQRHPELFTQQRLTETLGRVLTNAQEKIFVADAMNGRSKQLRLLLNREAPKIKTEETKP
jgi:modulator of FtsH protease HflK